MGAFFGVIFAFWIFGSFVAAIYFWFTTTDRSQAPLERRIIAMLRGLTWPYVVVRHFRGRDEAASQQAAAAARRQSILGGTSQPGSRPTPPPSQHGFPPPEA